MALTRLQWIKIARKVVKYIPAAVDGILEEVEIDMEKEQAALANGGQQPPNLLLQFSQMTPEQQAAMLAQFNQPGQQG